MKKGRNHESVSRLEFHFIGKRHGVRRVGVETGLDVVCVGLPSKTFNVRKMGMRIHWILKKENGSDVATTGLTNGTSVLVLCLCTQKTVVRKRAFLLTTCVSSYNMFTM